MDFYSSFSCLILINWCQVNWVVVNSSWIIAANFISKGKREMNHLTLTIPLLWSVKLEDGQVKLQSRLEQEEEAKAALLSRIQRLTKLILVSTKASQSSRLPQRPGPRRRHSFGEEEVSWLNLFTSYTHCSCFTGWLELLLQTKTSTLFNLIFSNYSYIYLLSNAQLAYLPHRRRDVILDDENVELYVSLEENAETGDDTLKEEKKTRKHGLLNWLKLRVCLLWTFSTLFVFLKSVYCFISRISAFGLVLIK